MDIAAADTRVIYGDEHIVRGLQRWFGALFEGDVVGFVEDEREVLAQLVTCLKVEGADIRFLSLPY